MNTLKYLLLSTRPRQWAKNFVVFIALIFSTKLSWEALTETGAAFALFCLLSGSAYIINDLIDLRADREHPRKRHRPLPSGRLSPMIALAGALVFLLAGVSISFWLNPGLGLIGTIYFLSMVAYSLVLKNVLIIDAFTIALGFVLRVVAGALVIDVPVSPWLYICTFLGALFLGLNKRRQEMVLLEENATKHRSTLQQYSIPLIDEMIAVVTASTLIAYSLYTFTAENLPKDPPWMMLTIPFVIYGIFRYLYLVHSKSQGDAPEEVLLTDIPLIIDIILWIAAAAVILFWTPAR